MDQNIKSSKDLINGKFYKVTASNSKYIFQYDSRDVHKMNRSYIDIVHGYYNIGSSGNLDTESNANMQYYTEATFAEIEHLHQCIAANKYVPYKQQNNQQYEIY
jgi:hypothetical protein